MHKDQKRLKRDYEPLLMSRYNSALLVFTIWSGKLLLLLLLLKVTPSAIGLVSMGDPIEIVYN